MRDIQCIIFGLALVAGIFLFSPDASAAQRAEIAAVVNDDIITTMDVDTRLLLNAGGRAVPPSQRQAAYGSVLNELIDESLKRQEADALNISVEEQEVENAFATVSQQNNMTPPEFRSQLQRAGIPVEAFYDKLRAEIAWGQVIRRKLRPQVTISENDIDAVFDTMERTEGEPQYRVAEIFLEADMMSDSAAIEKRMDDLIDQMKRGARFSDVARKYSEAPGASRGGDLGWMTLDQLDRGFQPVVLNMQPGQLSKPFKTAKGYHVLFMIDKRAPQTAAAPAAPAVQAEPAVMGPQMVRLQQIFIPVDQSEPEALKNTKMVRAAALKNEISGCSDMQAKSSGFDSPLTGDLGLVAVKDLPSPVASEVEALEVGTLSRPMRNQQGIFVLMVCERSAPRVISPATPAQQQASITPDNRENEGAREEVANTLGMQKLDALQDRYLRDLKSAAFIDRRI